jgi:hypothetical protein
MSCIAGDAGSGTQLSGLLLADALITRELDSRLAAWVVGELGSWVASWLAGELEP